MYGEFRKRANAQEIDWVWHRIGETFPAFGLDDRSTRLGLESFFKDIAKRKALIAGMAFFRRGRAFRSFETYGKTKTFLLGIVCLDLNL